MSLKEKLMLLGRCSRSDESLTDDDAWNYGVRVVKRQLLGFFGVSRQHSSSSFRESLRKLDKLTGDRCTFYEDELVEAARDLREGILSYYSPFRVGQFIGDYRGCTFVRIDKTHNSRGIPSFEVSTENEANIW